MGVLGEEDGSILRVGDWVGSGLGLAEGCGSLVKIGGLGWVGVLGGVGSVHFGVGGMG